MKFRTKPIVIEAIQWTGYNFSEMKSFVRDSLTYQFSPSWGIVPEIYIIIDECWTVVSIGDYIINGVKGEFYPCKQDVFEEIYEKV